MFSRKIVGYGISDTRAGGLLPGHQKSGKRPACGRTGTPR